MQRRRFLTIAAGSVAATAFCASAARAAPQLRQWHGTALGSAATIAMDHPQADRMIELARTEIARLEGTFSLYRSDSALSRLNRKGRLAAPPFELLECLSLCGRVHAASGGLFDPTIQPMWAAYAVGWSQGHAPLERDLDRARALTGWERVRFDASEISFDRPGMALTLNGVAQGLIADRVAHLLRDQGLSNVLVDTGEVQALGDAPDSRGWPVTLKDGPRITLRDRAVATSSLRGTVFDPGGHVGHILCPGIGAQEKRATMVVSVSAPDAQLADALSTASCLMDGEAEIRDMLTGFTDTTLEALSVV